MTLEFSKEALQAALAELLLATVSELNKRKHPGWAYFVYTKATLQGSLSTLHSLIDDDMSQSEYNQLMVDAGSRNLSRLSRSEDSILVRARSANS